MSAKDFDQSLGEHAVRPEFFQVQVSAIHHMSETSGGWLFSRSRFLL